MLTKPARARRFQMRNAVVGSWARTGLAAAAVVLILGSIAVLGATGRLGDLHYLNIPLIRPWPPAGFYQNPFNPTDRGDLMNASEAAKVKSDLVADGKLEVDAYAQGRPELLLQAETGRALTKSQQVVAQNDQRGLFEVATSQLRMVQVGRLADPNDAGISWMVEERGSSTLNFIAKATGQSVSRETFQFDGKFWMAEVDGHFLIADVEVTTSQ